MNDSIILRRVVRETMQAKPKRPWTVKAMFAFLKSSGFPDITESDVNAAMMWNQSRGFADYKANDETGQEEWLLTPNGIKAE